MLAQYKCAWLPDSLSQGENQFSGLVRDQLSYAIDSKIVAFGRWRKGQSCYRSVNSTMCVVRTTFVFVGDARSLPTITTGEITTKYSPASNCRSRTINRDQTTTGATGKAKIVCCRTYCASCCQQQPSSQLVVHHAAQICVIGVHSGHQINYTNC